MVVPNRRSTSVSAPVAPRCLPEQPNLEQLRKHAKELLRGYRSGKPSAVAEVNRFELHADKDRFALNDAQRVIARAYGFASWPKLKAFVDGANVARFMEAAQSGDLEQIRSMLASRPELASMDTAASNEHRAIHYAVLRRDVAMVRVLMEAGADARKGIFPHRDATTAMALAEERDYADVAAVIEAEERHRREEMSCLNATVSPAQDQISAAIARGDSGSAIRLLEADLSLIQACDRDGRTPLHLAAYRNDVELVTWLLARRASVRKKDPMGLTPLDHAALGVDVRKDDAPRFPAVAKLLLEHGAELTVRAAVALGDEALVRELIAAEPGLLRAISSDGGLVTLAVKHRQMGMVRLLLDLGADVDERIFLEELEEPTESWGMPLWHAALAGDFAIAKLLLDRGADPNANVYASGWPLRNACGHEGESVKKLLVERGARVHPYMVSEMHDVETARKILADNPDEEAVRELLWSAADHGCPEIVALALPHLGWALNDPRWNWVLIQPIRGAGGDSAANEGHFRSMKALLEHGVDPDISRYGQTPLHFAAARRGPLSGDDRARFAAMLIDRGARLDIRDDLLKSTPLGWACRWGRKELVEELLRRGAPVHESDAEPWATPIAWANKMGHGEILALLESN
jgi:ankyrin repeat protein